MKLFAILPAAGSGTRLGQPEIPKVLLPIGGVPMAVRTLRALAAAVTFERVIVAVRPQDRQGIARALAGFVSIPVEFVDGGASREDSVRNAVAAAAAGPNDFLLIHDADRPFIQAAVIRRTVERAVATGAAICAIQITDTIKEVSPSGSIVRTHARERFWLAQTPQVFRFDILERAYAARGGRDHRAASDEALLVESAGIQVDVVDGSRENIKITYREDLALGETIARMTTSVFR